ncbi:MAG: hypothetical protein ACW981_20615 [Candidatus Hodarchaeales archaeon]|jgi:uncharacterized repeat protein (TIGR04076 family)
MKISEENWKFYQTHLGYTDDEMKMFKENTRNEEVITKAPELMNKTLIAEVVEAHGCNSQHKVGDKFIFDGAGNLITRLCPKRSCVYALSSLSMGIFASNELFYAGVDPNKMRFKRVGCFDVGVKCGGWGRIIMELQVEDRQKK